MTRRTDCLLVTLVASSVAGTTLNSPHEPTWAKPTAWSFTSKALTRATGSSRPIQSALRTSCCRTMLTVRPKPGCEAEEGARADGEIGGSKPAQTQAVAPGTD